MFLAPIPFDYATLLDPGDRVRKTRKRTRPPRATARRPPRRAAGLGDADADLRHSGRRHPPDPAPERTRAGDDRRRTAHQRRARLEARPWRRRARGHHRPRRRAQRQARDHVEQRDKIRWGPIQINWGGELEVRITCPPGSDLDLAGGSTDLDVEGELGEVSAKSASGDIKLDDVRKRLEVKTASGDISVGHDPRGRHDRDRVRRPRDRSRAGPADRALGLGRREDRRDRGGRAARCRRSRATPGSAWHAAPAVWIDATSVSGDLSSELGLSDNAARRGTRTPDEKRRGRAAAA